MKAARLRGIRDVEIDDIPIPEPGPGEARVRVTRVGMCGSDAHYYAHMRIGYAVCEPGHIAGHEAAGIVDKLGPGPSPVGDGLSVGRANAPGLEDDRLAVGTRVAVEPHVNCSACERCLTGHPNQCPHARFISSPPYPGAFTEYICHPARFLLPVPGDLTERLTDEDVAMLEPLGVGIHAARRARVGLGDTVGVFGCGPIGLFTLQCARARGASRIFATDLLDYRLEFARKLGADETKNASSGGVAEWVKELTHGRGADVVFDCAGEQDSIDDCIEGVRIGGRMGMVGSPAGDRLSYDAHRTRRKELDMLNVRRSLFAHEAGFAMVRAGQVDLGTMVTHRFGLEEIARAFDLVDRYADGVVKAMIVVSE